MLVVAVTAPYAAMLIMTYMATLPLPMVSPLAATVEPKMR
jgi:hypothetical protein